MRAPQLARILSFVFVAGVVFDWVAALRPAYSHGTVTTSVSFDREIARILTRRCISCHSDNSLAFPLTTYSQTRPWARAIQEEIMARHMPPWRAVPGYGTFANDGGLTKREHQTMLAWIDGNGPKTPGQQVIFSIDQAEPEPGDRLMPDLDRWQLGTPDLVLPVGDQMTSPELPDVTVRTTLDARAIGERRVRALEFQPADRRALRAASFSLARTGQWLLGWSPWHGHTTLPAGTGFRIGSPSRISASLYYRGPRDRTQKGGRLGVYFMSDAARHCPSDLMVRASGTIAPGALNEKFTAETILRSNFTMLAFIPALPEGATSFEVRALQPDGRVTVLLLIRDALPDWPTPYLLRTPLTFDAGTHVVATTHYSNRSETARPAGVELRVSGHSGGCG